MLSILLTDDKVAPFEKMLHFSFSFFFFFLIKDVPQLVAALGAVKLTKGATPPPLLVSVAERAATAGVQCG